ncbi:cysteine-rich DPF motif domain-containing protein 1 isoform X2 [Lampetra planeri]
MALVAHPLLLVLFDARLVDAWRFPPFYRMMNVNKEQPSGGKCDAQFVCTVCKLHAPYNYYGRKPFYAKALELKEDSYTCQDPFETERGQLLVLGSNCSLCQRVVCTSQDCSLFYTRRFCLECIKQHISEFPAEIQFELKKRGVLS